MPLLFMCSHAEMFIGRCFFFFLGGGVHFIWAGTMVVVIYRRWWADKYNVLCLLICNVYFLTMLSRCREARREGRCLLAVRSTEPALL